MKSLYFLIVIIFLGACKPKEASIKKVAIQPIGVYDASLLDSLQVKIEQFYGVKALVYSPITMPKQFFVNIKSPRYRADSIIRYLRRIKPDTINYIIGLTNNDISTTKRDDKGDVKKPTTKYTDWGIFGLGFRPGPSCVISSYRMGSYKKRRVERAQKVALHELGHNMGLPHCPNKKCFMQDAAETIKTVDRVNFFLCEDCKSKI
jgi:archaemetzincin